jgi:hypothetical protein
MNKTLKHLTLAALLLGAAASPRLAMAQTNYTDATGETISASILDISSVEVSNDAFDLIFKIGLVGDPVATDWGKYMIGINAGGAGGATQTPTGNGWGRPINFGSGSGMDYWVGSWVDGGNGAQLWKYTGAWNTINAPTISKTTSNVTIRVPYGAMGLTSGNSLDFDVYTSGGGGSDGAIDALSTNGTSIANWGDTFTTVTPKTYTIVAPPAPTNDVFFQVDMGVPTAEATLTSGFLPGSDKVYVRGNFNAWPALPAAEYELKSAGGNLYTNTVKIVGNAGVNISYKYFIDLNSQEEFRVTSCNNDVRSATLNGTNLNTPLAYFGDRSLSDPTNSLTFQADMTVEIAAGRFLPGVDTVYARGTFNGYGTTLPLSPLAAPDTNIYVGTVGLTNWPIGACIKYKFQHDHTGAANSGYESGSDRSFTLATPNQTNAVRAFNDLDICDVTLVTNLVTFTVSMTNAVGIDNTVFDGTQSIYLNGGFAGWWTWGNTTNSAATNLLLTPVGGTSNYTITVAMPPGDSLRLQYKFSMNGADNEGNFGSDHVRYIRTVPGQTSYTLPLDIWTGTNAANIANLQEPKYGNLRAVPGAPGQVQVQWLGYKCVQLQSAGSLGGGSWVTYTNTSGFSSTNFPSSSGQQYFRLVDPSP